MYYESIIMGIYFGFLFTLFFFSQNVQRIADHPRTQAVVQKMAYNLRELPRVDYTELSSEEESEEEELQEHKEYDSEEESEDLEEGSEEEDIQSPIETDSWSENEEVVRKRRERNCYSRLVDVPN
jgi:hypothetical protein